MHHVSNKSPLAYSGYRVQGAVESVNKMLDKIASLIRRTESVLRLSLVPANILFARTTILP